MDENEIMASVDGKTIVGVEKWEYGVTFTFDDGSKLTVKSSGSGEHWVSVEDN